jgi:YD repeat-containing protein
VFPIYVDMRLDADPVTTTAYRATVDGVQEELPDDWAISVTRDDVEVLVIEAYAFTTYVQFVLELDYSVAGRTGTMRIDDEGQPLRVTGVDQQTLRYTYNALAEPGLRRTPQFDGALGTCHGWPDEVVSDDDLVNGP